MRWAALFVPLGISLAVGGGIMYYAGVQPAAEPAPSLPQPPHTAEVRHPVSEAMLLQAKLMSKKPAPYFKLKDVHGIDVQIGGTGKKPQFVYFILDGCPCSFDVQPLFNKLYRKYKDTVEFVGVINVGKAKTLDFAGQTTTLHPVVCDEPLKIVKAFGAKQSTYSALIRPDGTIEKMWPGYSESSLQDLNGRLAKLTGIPEGTFDAQYAPKKMTSGCFF